MSKSLPGAASSPLTITVDGVETDVSSLPWWRRPRRLRRQLVGALLLIALFSVGLVGALNLVAGRRLLEDGTTQQLVGVGEARARSIEVGIDRLLGRVSAVAADLAVVRAAEDLAQSFDDIGPGSYDASQVEELETFYQQAVVDTAAQAGLEPITVDEVLPGSVAGRYLQYHYVLPNADQPEVRREVVDPGDGSAYSEIHAANHPYLSGLASSLGAGDLLLVSARSDEVVYSVEKRIDLGTSLRTGPYNDTALADTVLTGLSRVPIGAAVIADQGLYLPGGGRPVVFAAAQIRRGTEVVGALVVEVPIETLNRVTTAGGDWEAVGLGAGESYVVGADRRLRSESRLWLEDPDDYLEQVDDGGLANLIEAFGSPVGLQPVDTEPVREAIEGRDYEGNSRNYLGSRTFSYATAIDAPGVDWVVVADVPLRDARGPLIDYAKRLGLVLLIILPAAGLVGFWLAGLLTRPIPPVVDAAFAVARGERNPDLPGMRRDEFGDLARQLTSMARQLGAQENALEDEYEQNRQMLLTVLPSHVVRSDGELEPESEVADVATAVAVGLELAREGIDEREVTALMSKVYEMVEGVADGAGVERIRAAADRYLLVAGLRAVDSGAERALEFASALIAGVRSLAATEDARLSATVGVATGSVATGVLTRGSLTYGAWGEPVRRALALSAIAQRDEVLVDASTSASEIGEGWAFEPAPQIVGLDGKPMSLLTLDTLHS